MSEARMIGELDAKIRQAKLRKGRKKSEWPWSEHTKNPDGSESGIEGYVYTPHGADFQLRGTVRWWRSAEAVKAARDFRV